MFLRHIFRQGRLFVKMPVAQCVGGQEHGAAAQFFNGRAGGPAQAVHFFETLFGREVIGRIIGRQPDNRDVPLGAYHMQSGDGAVVHTKIRVTHHLGVQPLLGSFRAAGFGQGHIDVQLKGIAKDIRKDGIDRFTAERGNPKKMMPLLRNPVRRVDQQHVRLEIVKTLAGALIRPAELFPAALRPGFVLGRVFSVHQVGAGAGPENRRRWPLSFASVA